MTTQKIERSRLGDLLVEMRLVDEESLAAALLEQRSSGRRLPRILAERRLLDEERLAKAVAAKLGLEAVNVTALKIHDRVLSLVPAPTASKHGVLPIAIKRTNQAEVLYLVMSDPLDVEAIAEVQRVTARQVRVLISPASELDQAIDAHYKVARATGSIAVPAGLRASGKVASTPPSGATPPPRPKRSESQVGAVVAPRPAAPPPRPRPANPLVAPVIESPRIVQGKPVEGSEPGLRRATLDAKATIIDAPRPPELQALLAKQRPVMPSALDPPDAVATRIDAPRAESRGGLVEHDWDLAVQEWPVESRRKDTEPLFADAQGPISASGPDIPIIEAEEIKTGQVELAELRSRKELRDSKRRSELPTELPRRRRDRLWVSTLEVPVEWDDPAHPFDGPQPIDVPVGLDRTGIIPAVDGEKDEFVPPPLPAWNVEERLLVGTFDIPFSAEAVRLRFGEASTAATDSDDIAAIEEVPLEPLEEAEMVELDLEASPPELDVVTEAPTAAALGTPLPLLAPATDSDAEKMPVIAASSLASLIEPADLLTPDAKVEPRLEPRTMVRMLEEEPTNPRIVSGREERLSARPKRVEPKKVAEPPPEEPTPAQDTVDRQAVMEALHQAFVEPAPLPNPERAAARVLVTSLLSGESLTSAGRAQLLLGLARLLIAKGIITPQELEDAL